MKKHLTEFLLILTLFFSIFLINSDVLSNEPILIMNGQSKDNIKASLWKYDDEIYTEKYYLVIKNESNFPIEFNYYADKYYYVINKDFYSLRITDGNPPYYPEKIKILNPHEQEDIMIACVHNETTSKFIEEMKNGKVSGLVASINYNKSIIVLILISDKK